MKLKLWHYKIGINFNLNYWLIIKDFYEIISFFYWVDYTLSTFMIILKNLHFNVITQTWFIINLNSLRWGNKTSAIAKIEDQVIRHALIRLILHVILH